MAATVDMNFLQTDRFEQFYLPPVKSFMASLDASDLSHEEQLIVFIVIVIFTAFIALLADLLIYVANENSLENRYTQLEKARAEIFIGRSDFDTDDTTLCEGIAGRIKAVDRVEDLLEVDANTRKHTFLDGIERDLKILVGKLNQDN